MQYVITINLDNDAFQVDQSGELREVLKQLSRKLKEYGKQEAGDKIKLLDSNGNTVGQAILQD